MTARLSSGTSGPFKGDKPTVHLDNLKGPNGLLYHRGALYVLDADSVHRVPTFFKNSVVAYEVK